MEVIGYGVVLWASWITGGLSWKLQALAVGDTSVLTQNLSLAVGLRCCLSR